MCKYSLVKGPASKYPLRESANPKLIAHTPHIRRDSSRIIHVQLAHQESRPSLGLLSGRLALEWGPLDVGAATRGWAPRKLPSSFQD